MAGLAISSPANTALKAARKLHSRRVRERTGLVLVEGPRAVREAGRHLVEVFVAERASGPAADAAAAVAAQGTPVRHVADDVFARLANTITPQGIVGVARRPAAALDDLADARFVIVLDGVADPGNLGTAIRTADAAGAAGVVCTAGSADPFGPKAVRASAGSVFHLPVVTGVSAAAVAGLGGHGLSLVALDPHAAVPLHAVDWSQRVALAFGGEAHGLSATLAAACSVAVHVPLSARERPGFEGYAESLNLAAAVAIVAFAVAGAQGSWADGAG